MHAREECKSASRKGGLGESGKRVSKALKAKELFARKTLLRNDAGGTYDFEEGVPPGKHAMWRRWVAV
jgi:hypothetical protein